MKRELLTERELRELRFKSTSEDRRGEILDIMRKDVKRANQRLLSIERAGLSDVSNSYQRAALYTDMEFGSNRFKFNSRLSDEELIDQYKEVRTFLAKESSTLSGIRSQQARFLDAMETFGIEIDDKESFFHFINSDTIQDAIDVIGNYDIIMDAINSAIQKLGKDLESIKREFDSFLAGRQHYDELITKLGGVSIDDLYARHRERKGKFSNRSFTRRR